MINFVFFGTSKFAVPILDILKKNGFIPKLIVTTPDKTAGRSLNSRSSPVKLWAESNSIPLLQPEKLDSSDFVKKISDATYPTAVVTSYGKIIPKKVLDMFPWGILNVHPSILPRHRGADPIRSAILQGDKESGVTIMLMDEKMDHGPILKSEILNLGSGIKHEKLEKELSELGGKLLVETIPKWLSGEIKPKEQEHEKATYTKKIKKEDGHLNWNESAEVIERKIRALNPWPGTYAFWNKKRIKILEASLLNLEGSAEGGRVFKYNSDLGIGCGNGSSILIKKLQLEGKNSQTTAEFLNGHPDFIGASLK